MNAFNLKYQAMILLFATLLTGLSAGLCFTWTNSITPGIGRMNDLGYLNAFQHMNRAILNPLFFIVFFGPLFLSMAAIYAHRTNPMMMVWMLIATALIYLVGVCLVTIFGNVPLNEVLDKTNLAELSTGDLKNLRDKFEIKWNNLHLIRTIASSVSFLLLIVACLSKSN